MGRQLGVIQFKGKLAETVGMRNGFGTGTDAFIRQYVQDISNPQTDTQLSQRAKMLPAVLFRRQLSEVIARAWEGKKYGGPSTREFMKYAMKEPWENIPQLAKDSVIPIPGEYLVSKGSLPTIGVTYDEDHIETGLVSPSEGYDGTIGSLSTILLENNDYLREGDQLTFIGASSPTGVPYVKYSVYSFFIDPNNTDNLPSEGSLYPNISDGVITVYTDDQLMLGGTVVLSREGQSSNQRSTQRFVVPKEILSTYFAASLKTSVAETYRVSQNSRTSRDWPYESEDVPETGFVNVAITIQPDGGGTVTGAGQYAKGDSVTVVATAASGYGFSGWYQGETQVSSNRTYTFQPYANTTLRAEFLPES